MLRGTLPDPFLNRRFGGVAMPQKAHKISANIPKKSPLYSYLATKEETGDSVGIAAASVQSNFVDLNTDHKNSKVLLINPPMCAP